MQNQAINQQTSKQTKSKQTIKKGNKPKADEHKTLSLHLNDLSIPQGPGDVIINDLQKTKTDNEGLRAQVAQLQKAVRELQAVNGSLQDEYKRSKAALDAAQRSVEKARQDYKKQDATVASLKAENESLRHKWVGWLISAVTGKLSLICNFYLSVAVHKIVCANPSLRYTSMLLGR